jgi:hypothetical protein
LIFSLLPSKGFLGQVLAAGGCPLAFDDFAVNKNVLT